MKHCDREMFEGINEGKKIYTCEVCGKQMEDRRLPENKELREFMEHYCIRRDVRHPDGHLCDMPTNCKYWKDTGCQHDSHPKQKCK